MSRYIAIEGCKKCPHRHYYSVGIYECLKYGTVLPASHILDIPNWCPLPKLPTPASAPETVVQLTVRDDQVEVTPSSVTHCDHGVSLLKPCDQCRQG